jgi:hypothetical protein
MAWLAANWVNLVVAILGIAEMISLFVPSASGTLSGIIKVLAGLPGVKDPGIGSK